MNLLIKFLYLITALLPALITVINFDISTFSLLQIFAVFWLTFLSILNLKFLILPLGNPIKSRSSFNDPSGFVALSHSFAIRGIIFTYSILSAGLIFLKAFVLGDLFSINLEITLQLVLLVVTFIMLWGFISTIWIEKFQSTPLDITPPKELASILDKGISQVKYNLNLNSQDELVKLLTEIKDKLYYRVDRADAYLKSKEYSELIHKINDLVSLLGSTKNSSEVNLLMQHGKKINSLF